MLEQASRITYAVPLQDVSLWLSEFRFRPLHRRSQRRACRDRSADLAPPLRVTRCPLCASIGPWIEPLSRCLRVSPGSWRGAASSGFVMCYFTVASLRGRLWRFSPRSTLRALRRRLLHGAMLRGSMQAADRIGPHEIQNASGLHSKAHHGT